MARRTLSIFHVVLRLRGGMQIFVKILATACAPHHTDDWSEPSGVRRLGGHAHRSHGLLRWQWME